MPSHCTGEAPKPSQGFSDEAKALRKPCNVMGKQQMAASVPHKESRTCIRVEKVAQGQILEARIPPRMDVLCLDFRFIPAFVVCYF